MIKSPKKKTSIIPTDKFVEATFANEVIDKNIEKEQAEKKGLLQKAHETITGQRQQDYGDKLQNFSQIAMLFQGVLATKLQSSAKITPEDVALLMMQVKIARLAKSPNHKDSILDVAGYAGCYDILQEERANGTLLVGATYDAGNSI